MSYRSPHHVMWLVCLAGLLAAAPGCELQPMVAGDDPGDATAEAATSPEVALKRLRAEMERLEQAMARSAPPPSDRPGHWSNQQGALGGENQRRVADAEASVKPVAARSAASTDAVDAQATQVLSNPQMPTTIEQPVPHAQVGGGRPEPQLLLASIGDAIRRSEEPSLAQAIDLALLAAMAPEHPLTEEDLASLSESQRQTVRQFRLLVADLRTYVSSDEASLEPSVVAERLRKLQGERPIRIRRMAVCKSVSGFGVYEPFEGRAFLAGRVQPMVVYAELEDFRVVQRDDGLHEVRLMQEAELYNEADGLAVWRAKPARMVDESRNRRQDFFVVQLIHLPARLNVGKYLLKLRVTDEHGGSLAEASLPLEFVADQALVTTAQK